MGQRLGALIEFRQARCARLTCAAGQAYWAVGNGQTWQQVQDNERRLQAENKQRYDNFQVGACARPTDCSSCVSWLVQASGSSPVASGATSSDCCILVASGANLVERETPPFKQASKNTPPENSAAKLLTNTPFGGTAATTGGSK